MVLNEEKRNRLAKLIARRQAALTGASDSAPVGPLTIAHDSPNPAPTDKIKGVVAIDFEDEDTEEDLVFRRPKVGVAATSLSAIDGRPPSFRDNPSNVFSPRGLLALEGDGESTLVGDQVPPAPELPAVLQQALKCFQEKEATEALGGDLLREPSGVPRQLPRLREPGGGKDEGGTCPPSPDLRQS